MRGVKTDLTGQRFGKLVVIGKSNERKRGYAVWRVKCDCGNESTFTTNSLCRKVKPTRSCGCLWKKPVGESSKHRVWLGYQRNAKKRNHVWDLTKAQFEELIQANCHYCGRPPSNISNDKEANGFYVYNGIDRKDDSQGYVWGNVVPCCRPCNWAKRHMSYVEFMGYIQQIVNYHNEKGTFVPIVRKVLMAAFSR
jgi:hypothetical protein